MKKLLYIVAGWLLCTTGVYASAFQVTTDSLSPIIVDTTFVLGAVDTTQVVADTTQAQNPVVYLHTDKQTIPPGTPVKSNYKADPDMAVWLAAVVPGLGQIYNRQYWKLPIVYGGAMGLGYAISWNNQMYIDYRKAYVDLIDADPNSTFYTKVLPNGVVIDASNKDYYTRTLKNKQDAYQRNRDLCIICTGVLYLLTLIDAYVDAQMADYDISPDLSLQVAPAVLPPSQYQQTDTSIGLRCKLKF